MTDPNDTQHQDPPAPAHGDDGGGHGDDPLDQLDDRARALVERANAEAAQRRRDLRAAEQARDQALAQLAEHQRSSESEQERAVREAEQRGRDAAAGEYEQRLVAADVIGAAGGRFRDPHDALAHVDLAALAQLTDPDERSQAITTQLDQLLDAKPYLAAAQNGGAGGPLVTPGGRSQQPAGSGDTSPDAWLRKQARRG